jgi:hypothetical protein
MSMDLRYRDRLFIDEEADELANGRASMRCARHETSPRTGA